MKEVCGLDPEATNFGWCFNCVPEENSVLFDFGDAVMELPALDVVLFRAHELLGEAVVGRFGAEFPIRFDFLDTMGGGNLCSRCIRPPRTSVRRSGWRTPRTSCYLLDAGPGATVYQDSRTASIPTDARRA
jgi:hypothetical protein